MRKLLFIGLLLLSLELIAQQDDYTLAMAYYKGKEYAKAADLFLKLYKSRKSKYYFVYYVKSMVQSEQYEQAKKEIKRQIRRQKSEAYKFYVDLGYVYDMQGDSVNAKKYYELALSDMPPNDFAVKQLASSFMYYNKFSWAEKVYLEGERITGRAYTKELANVYAFMRDYDKMIEKYLDYMMTKSSRFGEVKNIFAAYLKNDPQEKFATTLEKILIKRIQKDDNYYYEKMLVWLYLQKNRFFDAYVSAKVLAKKFSDNGFALYDVGRSALNAQDYETARKCFQAVVDLGRGRPFYWRARYGLLDVLYKQVENNQITSEEEIQNLENQYINIIDELGINSKTVDILRNLAHLEAFYLHKPQQALQYLNQAISIPRLETDYKASFLLEKGDVLLTMNRIYDAILVFARVEENFKASVYADQAAFKKAKCYFYLGQFDWAKSQFDVLKGSTSKLIANDAIYYSFFISENLGDDSLHKALKIYAKADLYYFARKLDSALLLIDTLLKLYPQDPITDDAYFLRYKIFYAKARYEEAAKSLEYIVQNYPGEILTDKSLFYLAQLFENQFNDKKQAVEYYKQIIFQYKSSFYVDIARKKYRQLISHTDR